MTIVPKIGRLLDRFAFAVIAFCDALYSTLLAVKPFLTVVCTLSPKLMRTPRATNVTAAGNRSLSSILFFQHSMRHFWCSCIVTMVVNSYILFLAYLMHL